MCCVFAAEPVCHATQTGGPPSAYRRQWRRMPPGPPGLLGSGESGGPWSDHDPCHPPASCSGAVRVCDTIIINRTVGNLNEMDRSVKNSPALTGSFARGSRRSTDAGPLTASSPPMTAWHPWAIRARDSRTHPWTFLTERPAGPVSNPSVNYWSASHCPQPGGARSRRRRKPAQTPPDPVGEATRVDPAAHIEKEPIQGKRPTGAPWFKFVRPRKARPTAPRPIKIFRERMEA